MANSVNCSLDDIDLNALKVMFLYWLESKKLIWQETGALGIRKCWKIGENSSETYRFFRCGKQTFFYNFLTVWWL